MPFMLLHKFAFAPLALHHVALSSYTTLYALDQVHMKTESEVQAEQAQFEAFTNLSCDQGKPQCIQPIPLSFILILGFMI
jgi:hypothetical protein